MPINPKVRVEITAIDRATATIKGVGNQISNISSSLMKLGAAYATVRVGFAAFEQLTSKVAQYGEEILIASQKTGMTTEQISALRFAAGQDNIEFDALSKSLGIFSRNLVGVGGKGKDAERVLEALGIASRDADGQILPMHDLLLSVAERFSKMKDGVEKAAAAQMLFGRSGAQLIPLLNQGASGIEELEKQAAALGITLDEKSARAADAFSDQTKVLGEMVHGLALQIGMGMIPTLLQWTVGLENIGLKLKEWKLRLEAVYYALSAVGAALSLHWKDAKGLWGMASDASEEAATAEIAYEAAVSKGTGELDRRIKTLKALGDIDEFGGPEKEKKAKTRKSDLADYIALLQQLQPELTGAEAVHKQYLETLQKIAQLEGQYDQAMLIHLADQQKAAGTTAALDEALKKLGETMKMPTPPAGLLATLDATVPAFHGAGLAAKKFGEEISHAFTEMLVFGRGGVDMLKSMITLLVEAILKAFVFKNIYRELGGATAVKAGGWSGLLAGFFGGLAGLQGGGPVMTGRPYLVGEAGPELFVPEVAGSVISHTKIGGATVNNVTNIDARGADAAVEYRIMRALAKTQRRTVTAAILAQQDAALRG
jgi:hypothetical protein